MKTPRPLLTFIAVFTLVLTSSAAIGQIGSTVANWTVPHVMSSATSGARTTMGDVTNPVPFIGVTPCRVADTRHAVGPFGGPALAAGSPRIFNIPAGPCTGIPSAVTAYSLNITAVNASGPGFILIYPAGGAQPVVSTLNYLAGQTIANAAIVPAGTSGGVTVVAGVSGTGLIIDINGYYGPTPGNANNDFQILNNSFGNSIFTDNSSTSCTGVCGIFARVESTNNAIALYGEAVAATGASKGVAGIVGSISPGAVGVYGEDGSGNPGTGFGTLPSGVHGASELGYGVVGSSRSGYGVKGVIIDSNNNAATYAYLGFDTSTALYGVGNFAASGTKNFVEPHPLDASKAIAYVALEGPEAGTYFRGSAEFHGGRATIEVPESFRMVTDTEGITVQVTPIGGYSQVYVESQDLNQIVVHGSRDVRFHYTVNGVRRSFKDFNPIVDNVYFRPESASSRMPGALAPEQKRVLIATGVYNEDGTVNMTTAQKMGWTKAWDERAAAAAQRAAAAASTPTNSSR